MVRSIAEKIDFLMKLTNTQNAALSRVLSFDASYISRIRNGKRGLPSEQPFIEPAAAYFARNIWEEYQKNAAAEELHLEHGWPENEKEAAALLAAWLKNETSAGSPVEHMVAAMTAPAVFPNPADMEYPVTGGNKTEASLFYGNAGKRDGVITFLTELCKTGRPHTIFLYSDEDMAWLYEDAAFARAWAALLGKLAKRGSKIKIIHSIARNTNEMWEAVQKWLPLYLSGAIEPYYYPRLRDGIYCRTLFVAVGHSAMVANSVQGQAGEPLNVLFRDKAAVLALEQEFSAYLAMCRPLMEIVYPKSAAELAPLLRAYLDAPGAPLAAFLGNVAICLKESSGVLVVKTAPPDAAFRLKEPRMVAAVEEDLRNVPGEAGVDQVHTITRLEAYINTIREE